MSDRGKLRVEAELRTLTPLGLSAGLMARLKDEAEEKLTLGDEVLAFCCGLGAVAAMCVASLVVWQAATAPVRPVVPAEDVAMHRETAAQVERWIAAR